MPVTLNTKVDDNDFEKLIPLAQVAASVTPVRRLVDDGDVASMIMALQTATGLPVSLRLDRQDWEKKLIEVQSKINIRTATLTIASPSVVTLATHGFTAGQSFRFSTTGALPTGVNNSTTYYVIPTGLTTGAFQFATTQNGTAINTSGTQSGVHSIYTV